MEGRTIAHIDPTWQYLPFQVGAFCTSRRTWSCCGNTSLKRCTCSIGRPSANSFGRLRARNSRLASTVHGRTGGWSGETILNTHPPTKSGRKHHLFTPFPKDRMAKYADARTLTVEKTGVTTGNNRDCIIHMRQWYTI